MTRRGRPRRPLLRVSNPTNQDDEGYGQCFTSGNCTIDQHINVQGDNETNSCSGTSRDIGLTVGMNSDGTFHSTCGGVSEIDVAGCPNPPSPPPIPFPIIGDVTHG